MQEVRTKKRSLREVLPPKNLPSVPPALPADDPPISEPRQSPGAGKRRWWLGVLVVLALVASFLVSQAWARATVAVTPFSIDLALDEKVEASLGGADLTFGTITLPPRTGGKLVKASGIEKVSRPASGQIVIYNNYDKNPQRLIANTRFETPAGKIYRIREPVTVPGMTTVNGKLVPGTLEVTVYADEPGPGGNGPATDFSIPGFKNDPRFNKFFARSKTPLSGGLIGEVPKLSAEEETRARVALRSELTKELLKEARFKIPESQVLFDGAALLDWQDVTDWQAAASDSVMIKESATLTGVTLPRVALSNKLINTKVPNFSPDELRIINLESLSASLAVSRPEDLRNAKEIAVNIRGSARAVALVNRQDLAAKLAGLKQAEINSILANFKNISKAEVSIWPLWISRIPADPADIIIELDDNNDSLLH